MKDHIANFTSLTHETDGDGFSFCTYDNPEDNGGSARYARTVGAFIHSQEPDAVSMKMDVIRMYQVSPETFGAGLTMTLDQAEEFAKRLLTLVAASRHTQSGGGEVVPKYRIRFGDLTIADTGALISLDSDSDKPRFTLLRVLEITKFGALCELAPFGKLDKNPILCQVPLNTRIAVFPTMPDDISDQPTQVD